MAYIHTEEIRLKRSQSLKKAHSEGRHSGGFKNGNMMPRFTGRSHSEAAKKKQSEAKKLDNPMFKPEAQIKISASRMGEKNHNWKGGVSKHRNIRYNHKYKKWRLAVLLRDNYTCVKCGANKSNSIQKYMTAHHLKQFGFYPELRYDVSNGETLCVKCHSVITGLEMTENHKGKRVCR